MSHRNPTQSPQSGDAIPPAPVMPLPGRRVSARRKTAAGRCCHSRCAQPIVDGTTRCEKHHAHHRAEVARRKEQHLAAGLCGLCNAQAVPGKARCETHDPSKGVYRCGNCREVGHNRMTCPLLAVAREAAKERT